MQLKNTFSIFWETPLRSVLDRQLQVLLSEIQTEDKNKLLSINETEYVNYLAQNYEIEPLVLHFDQVSVSSREEMISAEFFPQEFNVLSGRNYSKQVVAYHIPFNGSPELLKCQPTGHLMWTKEVYTEENCVCFGIINFRDDADQIRNQAEEFLNGIRQQHQNVFSEIQSFNGGLEAQARQAVQSRKAAILKQSGLLESLGVPFYKAQQVPATFSVPAIKKKVVIKPQAPSDPFSPEPTLDESTYEDILGFINQYGREMERHPNVYADKDEPTLRDHLIMVLTPQFEVTGETFNKSGKTDILIRHQGKNLFVAECKFWKGIEEHLKTIDQLLGYLTWRDSKTAVISFIRNKELNPVLKQIEVNTSKHPSFVKYTGKRDENWFSFEFHLPKDPSRGVRLSMLCFHFPDN